MQATDLAAQDPSALADYNAGQGGNVLKWMRGTPANAGPPFWAAIGFDSTRRYVDSGLVWTK